MTEWDFDHPPFLLAFFFFLSLFIYFWGWDRERGRERISSRLRAVSIEPYVGLELTKCEIMTWAETKSPTLNWRSHSGALTFFFLIIQAGNCVLFYPHRRLHFQKAECVGRGLAQLNLVRATERNCRLHGDRTWKVPHAHFHTCKLHTRATMPFRVWVSSVVCWILPTGRVAGLSVGLDPTCVSKFLGMGHNCWSQGDGGGQSVVPARVILVAHLLMSSDF